MRNIRRAAVTGLFAIWLAPLSAVAEAPGGSGLRTDRSVQVQPAGPGARRDTDEEDGAPAEADKAR